MAYPISEEVPLRRIPVPAIMSVLLLVGCQEASPGGQRVEGVGPHGSQATDITLPGVERRLDASVVAPDPIKPPLLRVVYTMTNNGEAAIEAEGTPMFAHAVIRSAVGQTTSIDPLTTAVMLPVVLSAGASLQETWSWEVPSEYMGAELEIEVRDVFHPAIATTTRLVVPVSAVAN